MFQFWIGLVLLITKPSNLEISRYTLVSRTELRLAALENRLLVDDIQNQGSFRSCKQCCSADADTLEDDAKGFLRNDAETGVS